MEIYGHCALVFIGDSLNFDEIEHKLNLKASETFRKGEIYSKFIGENPNNVFIIKQELSSTVSLDKAINILTKQITDFQIIRDLAKKHDVKMRCFVQSDSAQIDVCIYPETLEKLNCLGVVLEISILSWGKVIND